MEFSSQAHTTCWHRDHPRPPDCVSLHHSVYPAEALGLLYMKGGARGTFDLLGYLSFSASGPFQEATPFSHPRILVWSCFPVGCSLDMRTDEAHCGTNPDNDSYAPYLNGE